MPPAVIAAGVGAAGAIGGAVLSSKAQKSAAKTAAAAETQAANNNMALAREFQAQNQGNLQPWLNSGTQANALVNSFLFGPQSAQAAMPAPSMGQAGTDWNAYLSANPDVAAEANRVVGTHEFGTPGQYAQWHFDHYGRNEGRQAPQLGGTVNTAQPAQQNALMDGYKAFEASPYYQFPLQEGMRQLNNGLASSGKLNSGDAMKAAIQYGQNYGSGRLGEFIGLAENQSNRGLQAGGAIAGVGVNALNSMTNSNNAIGQAGANRALAAGQANAGMYSTIGNALGTLAGSVFPTSSYRF